jgi:hypothetical protein
MAMGLCSEIGAITHDAKPLMCQSALEHPLSNTMVTDYFTVFKEGKNRLIAKPEHAFALCRN